MGNKRSARRAVVVAAVVGLAIVVPAPASQAFTVFKVTNTNDSGDGSLRRAINDAKADPGIDAIFFKIPGPGVHTIQPLTDLPVVADHIAGDSQPGYAGTPLIQLDGSMDAEQFTVGLDLSRGVTFGVDVVDFSDGVWLTGPATILASVVGADPGGAVAMPNTRNGISVWHDGAAIGDAHGHGNTVSGNGAHGVGMLEAASTTIEGNRIGTTSSGLQALGNDDVGIFVNGDADDTVIGGDGAAANVVSGNGDAGIAVQGSKFGRPDRTIIQGNVIGLDAGGVFPIPNGDGGVSIAGANATHVGTWPSTGNVIAGNHGPGVEVVSTNVTSRGTTLDSNLIGVNSSGGESVPNSEPGVVVDGVESTRIGQRIAPGHIGEPNVISGNQGGGILIAGSDMTNVFGNQIGVGANGALPVPNIGRGITIRGGADTHIGGGLAGQGNVISANTGDGILIGGEDATGTPASRVSVQANFIGTDRATAVSIANGGNGISVLPKADGTRIGNVVGVEGPNAIDNNSGDGVLVTGSVGVRIRGNEISNNSQLGIHLVNGGNHQPFVPTLTNVKLANGQLTVKGTLFGIPSRDFSIELFGSPVCDPSGAGEGESFLGSHKVTTDSSGSATFTIKVPYGGAAAPVVTATDTNTTSGNTSEFSLCK